MNGNEAGQNAQNARQMTEEIDRLTDLATEEQHGHNEQTRGGESSLNRDQASNLGSRVLTYNPERNDSRPDFSPNAGLNTERVQQIAEADAGYQPETRVNFDPTGTETPVQSQEWLAEDREDIENELGLNGKYVKRIMDRNQKNLTAEAVEVVDKIISKNNYHPNQLDEAANSLRTSFLKDVFNRILGSRNWWLGGFGLLLLQWS